MRYEPRQQKELKFLNFVLSRLRNSAKNFAKQNNLGSVYLLLANYISIPNGSRAAKVELFS